LNKEKTNKKPAPGGHFLMPAKRGLNRTKLELKLAKVGPLTIPHSVSIAPNWN
jgi:hypothetical protein